MILCFSARHMNVHVIGEVQCKVCLIRFTKQSLEIHTKEAHPELTDHEVVNDVSQKRKRNEGVSVTLSWHYFIFQTLARSETSVNLLIQRVDLIFLCPFPVQKLRQ